MRKRMLLMLGLVAIFVASVGTVKFLQIRAAIAQGMAFRPPPEAVTTIVAEHEEWPATLEAIGTVAAVRGVTVSADLPGVIESIHFDSGRRVPAGGVLVRLDTRQERAQRAAAEAQRDLARLNFERARSLLAQNVIAQAEYDRLAAEAKQADARLGEIDATIERKLIRAPFAGVLGLRQVNVGQYLNGGDPVVSLQAMDEVYVNFSVPQQTVGALRVGAPVRVWNDSTAVSTTGRITAIDAVVDAGTRNVSVQATFDNRAEQLRPGMFVEARVTLGRSSTVTALPASAISYAPYGNSVFIVGDMKGPDGRPYRGVRQQFVKLGGARGDQVAVLSGVTPGQEVVTSGVFKLRNGAAIQVNNQKRPSNDPAPDPEDS
jgi:membrane fusion protein (multidrug efflux system)